MHVIVHNSLSRIFVIGWNLDLSFLRWHYAYWCHRKIMLESLNVTLSLISRSTAYITIILEESLLSFITFTQIDIIIINIDIFYIDGIVLHINMHVLLSSVDSLYWFYASIPYQCDVFTALYYTCTKYWSEHGIFSR